MGGWVLVTACPPTAAQPPSLWGSWPRIVPRLHQPHVASESQSGQASLLGSKDIGG